MRAAVCSSSAGKENAYAYHPRTAVRSADGPERAALDLQVGVVGSQLAFDLRRVERRVAVDHADPFERPHSDNQLDQPPQGAFHRPYPLHRPDFALANAQDG